MKDDLLVKYILQKCSPKEVSQVEKWITSNPDNAAYFFDLEILWGPRIESLHSDPSEIEQEFKRLDEKKAYYRPQHKIFEKSLWVRIAAAAILILFFSTIQYFIKEKKSTEVTYANNIIEVPVGERVHLILSDGTNVWLNSGSRFEYPGHFSSKSREVKMQGEGFFEVAHKKDSPFIIHSSSIRVKVLGTTFNFSAYNDEPAIVTLINGSVEVGIANEVITMQPNDQVYYTKEKGLQVKRSIKTTGINAWTTGSFHFDSTTLESIVKNLERRFGKPIYIESEKLKKMSFKCHTAGNVSLIQVLDILKATNQIDYKENENCIKIVEPLKKKSL